MEALVQDRSLDPLALLVRTDDQMMYRLCPPGRGEGGAVEPASSSAYPGSHNSGSYGVTVSSLSSPDSAGQRRAWMDAAALVGPP